MSFSIIQSFVPAHVSIVLNVLHQCSLSFTYLNIKYGLLFIAFLIIVLFMSPSSELSVLYSSFSSTAWLLYMSMNCFQMSSYVNLSSQVCRSSLLLFSYIGVCRLNMYPASCPFSITVLVFSNYVRSDVDFPHDSYFPPMSCSSFSRPFLLFKCRICLYVQSQLSSFLYVLVS
jgi:hypothetical protein